MNELTVKIRAVQGIASSRFIKLKSMISFHSYSIPKEPSVLGGCLESEKVGVCLYTRVLQPTEHLWVADCKRMPPFVCLFVCLFACLFACFVCLFVGVMRALCTTRNPQVFGRVQNTGIYTELEHHSLYIKIHCWTINVQCSMFNVQSSKFKVQSSKFKVQSSKFNVCYSSTYDQITIGVHLEMLKT